MPLTAREIMETQVITLSPDEPLAKVQRLFFEEEIHGAPVVADDGRILGMITSLDLLRAAAEEHESSPPDANPPSYLRELFEFSEPDLTDAQISFQEQLGERVVEEIMTRGVITVSPDTLVPQIARTLRENRIHRVLVAERGVLRGIISTFDLVGLLEKEN